MGNKKQLTENELKKAAGGRGDGDVVKETGQNPPPYVCDDDPYTDDCTHEEHQPPKDSGS